MEKELKILDRKDVSKSILIEMPKRIVDKNLRKINPTLISFQFIKEFEYAYFPKKFARRKTFLTIEELEAIIKKLKQLNSNT